MSAFFQIWCRCCRGATAIEYALLAGGIALAIVATVIALGGDIETLYGRLGHMASLLTEDNPNFD